MSSKTCNVCNLTLDISNFHKTGKQYYRNVCKKCYNKTYKCQHGNKKTRCRECGGGSICKHNIRKERCHECGGSGLCKHNKQKSQCHKCKGSQICKHGTRKATCHKCGGSQICKHKKQKSRCRECGGNAYCEHGILKQNCRICKPNNFCKHHIKKTQCYICKGSSICKHGSRKSCCRQCGGSQLCIHCKYTRGNKRYIESLDKNVNCCADCFYRFYPNDEIPRRFKCKQHYFNEKLIEEFGVDFFQYDKKIKCGCSGRKPDWFIDCFKYSIIIELDEDQHKYTSCDEKRMMELFTDLGNRPLVLIRINPDKYEGRTKKRKGCFDFDEKNTLICNEKKFNKRFNILVEMIKYFIDNEPEKEITMEKLFFDRK